MMRKPFIAGNWKMNTDSHSSVTLAQQIASETSDIAGQDIDVAVIPPFVYIPAVVRALSSSRIAVGAQDIFYEQEGAFTGEISCKMLKDAGCNYVLCGHSERRHVIGESDEIVNKKTSAALLGGLLPILCVGELIEQRQNEKTTDVITEQLEKGLSGFSEAKVSAVTFAYEPVWAIGTGLTARPEQAQQVHKLIRDFLADKYGRELAEGARILYGGSVKPDNAKELMAQEDVDGTLVGGASLKSDAFTQIIKAAS